MFTIAAANLITNLTSFTCITYHPTRHHTMCGNFPLARGTVSIPLHNLHQRHIHPLTLAHTSANPSAYSACINAIIISCFFRSNSISSSSLFIWLACLSILFISTHYLILPITLKRPNAYAHHFNPMWAFTSTYATRYIFPICNPYLQNQRISLFQ